MELAEHLEAAEPVNLFSNRPDPAFVVDDDSKAAWAARKANRARTEVERIEAQARAEIERIEEWARDATAGPRGDFEFFEGLLLGYLHRLTEEKGDDMPDTYKVLGAELKRRKQPDSVVFEDPEDEQAFVDWAIEAGHRKFVKLAPKKDEIKKLVGDALATPDLDLDDKGKPKLGSASRLVDAFSGEPIPGVVYRVGEKKSSVQITRNDP